MRRREFLQIVSVFPLGWIGWNPGRKENRPPDRATLARPVFLDIVNDPDEVRSIGAAFRSAHPEEGSAGALMYRLASEIGGVARPSSRDIQQRLARSVQADFARGRTIQLEGWILSVTEARQCALYSLLY